MVVEIVDILSGSIGGNNYTVVLMRARFRSTVLFTIKLSPMVGATSMSATILNIKIFSQDCVGNSTDGLRL